MSTNTPASPQVPRYPVPNKEFVTVEHPFIAKNADKAIDMLGGRSNVAEALQSGKIINLKFNPSDPTARNLASLPDTTDNVLLRITVPKRIGKRKRGSNEPFVPLQTPIPVMRDVNYLLRSMRDNKEKTAVEVIGSIRQSHVWRSMPDFDYSIQGLDFLSNLQSNIMPQDYAVLQQWSLPKTYGLQNTEVAPPPVFSTHSLPQPYVYHQPNLQHSTVSKEPDREAAPRADRREKSFTVSCSSAGPFPTAPPVNAPQLDSMSPAIQKAVPILRALFKQRPIWSRRALGNNLEEGLTPSYKIAVGFLAFSISSGVWSRTLCAYGVDPSSDPKYRKFQTIATIDDQKRDGIDVMVGSGGRSVDLAAEADRRRSHIFTGQGPLLDEGKIFQLCDLQDPQLKLLVDIDDSYLSKELDSDNFGWYGNGTMSKIRIILRSKLSAIRNGEHVPNTQFERMLAFPEQCDVGTTVHHPENNGSEHLPNSSSAREKALRKAYYEACRNGGRFKMRNTDNVQRFESDSEDFEDADPVQTTPQPHEGNVLDFNGSVDDQDDTMQEKSVEESSHRSRT